ncbi:MAG: DUF3309 family protein [Gemmatimonadales bacterium]
MAESVDEILLIARSFGAILIIVLLLMLVGVLPTWQHSRSWGYYPSGGLGIVLLMVLLVLLLGRI